MSYAQQIQENFREDEYSDASTPTYPRYTFNKAVYQIRCNNLFANTDIQRMKERRIG